MRTPSRSVVRDAAAQATAADQALGEASLITVPLPALCEFVCVLRRVYGFDHADVAAAIRALLATRNVVTNRPAVEADLALPEASDALADGVIAYEGNWLGGSSRRFSAIGSANC
jgi:predicted nucleic-acid-binding protein